MFGWSKKDRDSKKEIVIQKDNNDLKFDVKELKDDNIQNRGGSVINYRFFETDTTTLDYQTKKTPNNNKEATILSFGAKLKTVNQQILSTGIVLRIQLPIGEPHIVGLKELTVKRVNSDQNVTTPTTTTTTTTTTSLTEPNNTNLFHSDNSWRTKPPILSNSASELSISEEMKITKQNLPPMYSSDRKGVRNRAHTRRDKYGEWKTNGDSTTNKDKQKQSWRMSVSYSNLSLLDREEGWRSKFHSNSTKNVRVKHSHSPRKQTIDITDGQKKTDTEFIIYCILKSIEIGENVVMDPEEVLNYKEKVSQIYWAWEKDIINSLKNRIKEGYLPLLGNYSRKYGFFPGDLENFSSIYLYLDLFKVKETLEKMGYETKVVAQHNKTCCNEKDKSKNLPGGCIKWLIIKNVTEDKSITKKNITTSTFFTTNVVVSSSSLTIDTEKEKDDNDELVTIKRYKVNKLTKSNIQK